MSLVKTLSLGRLEFSENRCKKRPSVTASGLKRKFKCDPQTDVQLISQICGAIGIDQVTGGKEASTPGPGRPSKGNKKASKGGKKGGQPSQQVSFFQHSLLMKLDYTQPPF